LPASWPVRVSKLAQGGFPSIPKVSESPSPSPAAGLNE